MHGIKIIKVLILLWNNWLLLQAFLIVNLRLFIHILHWDNCQYHFRNKCVICFSCIWKASSALNSGYYPKSKEWSIGSNGSEKVTRNPVWNGVCIGFNVLWNDLPDKLVWGSKRCQWSHDHKGSPSNDLSGETVFCRRNVRDLRAKEGSGHNRLH